MSSPNPGDSGMTEHMDRFYSRIAGAYSWLTQMPPWRGWIESCLPYVVGRSVLEVSFGPGWLLPIVSELHLAYGIDLNWKMCRTAKARLEAAGCPVRLARANVENLPFGVGAFDCVLNSMAFSGYPHAGPSLAEMMRVVRPGGRLILLDFVRSNEMGAVGRGFVALGEALGDVIRRMDRVFQESGLAFQSHVIGAGGSLQLFLVDKPSTQSKNEALGGPSL